MIGDLIIDHFAFGCSANECLVSAVGCIGAFSAGRFDTDPAFQRRADLDSVEIERTVFKIRFLECVDQMLILFGSALDRLQKVVESALAEEVFLPFAENCDQRFFDQMVIHQAFRKCGNFLFYQRGLQFDIGGRNGDRLLAPAVSVRVPSHERRNKESECLSGPDFRFVERDLLLREAAVHHLGEFDLFFPHRV